MNVIAYCLAYGTILAKMGRVYKIFHNPTPKKQTVRRERERKRREGGQEKGRVREEREMRERGKGNKRESIMRHTP